MAEIVDKNTRSRVMGIGPANRRVDRLDAIMLSGDSEKDLSTVARAAPLTHERVAVGKPPVPAHDPLSLVRNLRSREQVTGVAS
jgi:hypothetical protein